MKEGTLIVSTEKGYEKDIYLVVVEDDDADKTLLVQLETFTDIAKRLPKLKAIPPKE